MPLENGVQKQPDYCIGTIDIAAAVVVAAAAAAVVVVVAVPVIHGS